MVSVTAQRVDVQALAKAAKRLCPWWAEATTAEQDMVLRHMELSGMPPEQYWSDGGRIEATDKATLMELVEEDLAERVAEAAEHRQAEMAVASNKALADRDLHAEPPRDEDDERDASTSAKMQRYADQCVSHFAGGEVRYRDSLLLAALYGHRYIEAARVQGETREAAALYLSGALSKAAGVAVKANELVKAYWAVVRLHCEPNSLPWERVKDFRAACAALPHIPYTTIRDAFAQCVNRDAKTNTYALPDDKAVACVEVWRTVIEKQLSRDGAATMVRAALGKAAKAKPEPEAEPEAEPAAQPTGQADKPQESVSGANPAGRFADGIKQATPKDAAASIADLFDACDAPDDLFLELCRELKRRKNMGKAALRAVDGAILVMERGAPVTVEVIDRPAAIPA